MKRGERESEEGRESEGERESEGGREKQTIKLIP